MNRRWTIALRCLPLGLLAVVLWREKPWAVALSASAPWAVTASILLNLAVSLPLKAARWRVALIDPPPYRQVLAATIEGLLASIAIGFGSGDMVRSARLRRPGGRPEANQVAVDYASSLAERGAEVFALGVLVFVAALVTDLGALALALSGLAVAGYLAVLARGPRVRAATRRMAARAARALGGIAGVHAAPGGGDGGPVAARVGERIVMLLLFQQAFHLEPSFRTALLTLVGINAAVVIPTLPGNFGTFEAGVTMALVMCGAPRDVAVMYALTYHLSHVVPVAVLATAVYLVRSRGRAAARSARRYLRIAGEGVPVYTSGQRGFVTSAGQVVSRPL